MKAIKSGTQRRKNKIIKRPIDLTGINKAPILDKCPSDNSPPSNHAYMAYVIPVESGSKVEPTSTYVSRVQKTKPAICKVW